MELSRKQNDRRKERDTGSGNPPDGERIHESGNHRCNTGKERSRRDERYQVLQRERMIEHPGSFRPAF